MSETRERQVQNPGGEKLKEKKPKGDRILL